MHPEHTERRARLLLTAVLLIFAVLAVGYGLVTPVFEAPDEQHHFFTASYIAQNWRLPTVSEEAGAARQEAAQPPLYYALAATLIAPLDIAGAEEQLWPNPTVRLGEPAPANVNAFVHTTAEAWPWRGYALAVHLLRIAAVLAGAGTLLCIYHSGRLLFPAHPAVALLATALVAFLPQFAFLHGAVTNDVLIILLASLALWQLLRLWLEEATTGRLLLLGVTIGLAVLTKMAGLLLVPLAGLVLALTSWRVRRGGRESWPGGPGEAGSWSRLVWAGVLVLGPLLLLSGWLLWRNWILYGDITAVNQFVALAGGPRPYTLRQVWSDLDRVALSSVAFFGWMNVLPPRWLHATWLVLALLAAAGTVLGGLRWARMPAGKLRPGRDRLMAAGWLALWLLLVGVAWLRFMVQTPADQGRLLFPALLPLALFVSWGLCQWRQRWLLWAAAALALFTSVYALLVVLPGAYKQAVVLVGVDLPATAVPLEAPLGAGLTLVAVEPPDEVVQPGDWAWVTLYWRADTPPQEAPLERLGLYGRDNALVGTQRNYHGGGTFPATEWPPGQIVRERLGARVAETLDAPVALRMLLRLNEAEKPLEIARVKAVPGAWPAADGPALAELDGWLDLISAGFEPQIVAPGTAVTVALRWRVHEAPDRDLRTFVHLGDPAAPPLAQSDGPALGGDYPTTYWAAGEVIDDQIALVLPTDLPPGSYPLQLGMYDPQDGRRLPVTIDGERQSQDVYPLGQLIVR